MSDTDQETTQIDPNRCQYQDEAGVRCHEHPAVRVRYHLRSVDAALCEPHAEYETDRDGHAEVVGPLDHDAPTREELLDKAETVRSTIEGTLYAVAAGEAERLRRMLRRADDD